MMVGNHYKNTNIPKNKRKIKITWDKKLTTTYTLFMEVSQQFCHYLWSQVLVWSFSYWSSHSVIDFCTIKEVQSSNRNHIKVFNPFAPEPSISACADPRSTSFLPLVMSSVLTVKDNFVRWLVQSEESFQTIPEWAQFSQGHWRKGKKPCNIDLKISMKILFHCPPTFPFT